MEEKEHKGKETNRERFGANASPILYSGFRYSSFTHATRSIDIHFRLTIASRVYLSMQTRRLKIRNIRMPVCNVAVTEKRFIAVISSREKINANCIYQLNFHAGSLNVGDMPILTVKWNLEVRKGSFSTY